MPRSSRLNSPFQFLNGGALAQLQACLVGAVRSAACASQRSLVAGGGVGGSPEPVVEAGAGLAPTASITRAWVLPAPVYPELAESLPSQDSWPLAPVPVCLGSYFAGQLTLLARARGPGFSLQGSRPLVARARGPGFCCRTLAPARPRDVLEFGLPGLAPSLLLVTRQGVAAPVHGRGPLNFTVF